MFKLLSNLFFSVRSVVERTQLMGRSFREPQSKTFKPQEPYGKNMLQECADASFKEMRKIGKLGEIEVIDVDIKELFKDRAFAEAFDSPVLSDDVKYGPGSALKKLPKGEIPIFAQFKTTFEAVVNAASKNKKDDKGKGGD